MAVGQIGQSVNYARNVAFIHFPAGSGVMVGSHGQIRQPYGRSVWQPDEKLSQFQNKKEDVRTEALETQNTRRMVKEAKTITATPVAPLAGSSSNRKTVAVSVAPPPKIQTSLFDDTEPKNNGEYHKPNMNLLRMPSEEPVAVNPDELQQTAELIEAKLAEFGIGVQVVSATSGPVITRYEIEPAQGVKGSQIVALSKDLARSMSLQAVRIVETIAGKNTMGIELPNEKRQRRHVERNPLFTRIYRCQVKTDRCLG